MTETTRGTRPCGNFAWTQHTPCLGCIRKFEHKCTCKAFYHYDSAKRKSIQLRYPPAHFPTTSILDLPAELRNQIYELVFVKPDTLHHDWWQPCFTFATRQIRQESLPLFYASTHFCIRIRPGQDGELADIKQAKRWALSLDDKHVRDMRKLSIHANIPLDYFPHLDLVYDLDIGADAYKGTVSLLPARLRH
nr:hypothetical protein B0A51_06419 [Rachicladosporium sp. CCFEE 5018]